VTRSPKGDATRSKAGDSGPSARRSGKTSDLHRTTGQAKPPQHRTDLRMSHADVTGAGTSRENAGPGRLLPDLGRRIGGSGLGAAQNWADSVDSAMAVVEEAPLLTAFDTASK
jgi:hypothetical protein